MRCLCFSYHTNFLNTPAIASTVLVSLSCVLVLQAFSGVLYPLGALYPTAALESHLCGVRWIYWLFLLDGHLTAPCFPWACSNV